MNSQNINIKQYTLSSGRKLYFSAQNNHFWFDEKPAELTIDYYDKKLISLRLELSGYCNGHCKYCIVYGNQIEKKEILDIESSWDWLTSLSWFKHIKDIFIIGGEPMLHYKDIFFILNHFDGTVGFSTNGTLITKEIAQQLSKYNVMVYVSIDGANESDNVNRVYKNGKPMYPDIIKGLDLLEAAGVRKGLFMVATPNTVNNISDNIQKLTQKYKFKRIGYSLPHWTKTTPDTVTAEQYRDALLDLYSHRNVINTEIMQLNWRLNPLIEGKVKEFSCSLHNQQIKVLPDKSIVRCSKIDSISDKKYITNAWLDENCPTALARKNMMPCAKCVALSCCGGGCPFDGIKRFNSCIDKRECVITIPLVEKALQDIVCYIEKEKSNLPSGDICQDVIKEALSVTKTY